MDEFDPQALTVAQARRRIQAEVRAVSAVERVAIRDALGRVLAETVVSPLAVPQHDN